MARHRGHNEGTIYERTHVRKDGAKVTRYVAQSPADENGKRSQLGRFKTRVEARQALKDVEIARSQRMQVTGKVPTVKEWCEQFLAGRTRIAYSTRRSYETSFKSMLPYIGRIRIDTLVEADIAQMWRKLRDGVGQDGKPRSPLASTTLELCHRHLNAALRSAARNRHIAVVYNPAASEEARPEKGEREPINPLIEQEVQQLFAATRESREYPLWVLLITTGVRIGEAQALRWEDVDFERSRIYVRHSLHRETGKGQVLGPTKTRKTRAVDLRPATVAALRTQKAKQAEMRLKAGSLWDDVAFVFTSDTGKPLDHRASLPGDGKWRQLKQHAVRNP